MLRFDEAGLVVELDAFPNNARIAFAAAATTRQLTSYERFAREARSQQRPREIAADLWHTIQRSTSNGIEWSLRLEEVMALLPDEGGADCDIWHALAEDALSSLAYAIRCLLKPEAQEAAWAARRSYEAADQAVIRLLSVQPGTSSAEAAILSHEIVQRELLRQRNDLTLLCAGSIDEVKRTSFDNQLLTKQEADILTPSS